MKHLLLTTALLTSSAQAQGLSSDINAWASELKCSNIATISHANPDFVKFTYWFSGFLAALSSAGQINLVKEKMSDSLITMVLVACQTKPNTLVVEQTLDASSLVLHLDPIKEPNPPNLKNPFEGANQ